MFYGTQKRTKNKSRSRSKSPVERWNSNIFTQKLSKDKVRFKKIDENKIKIKK